MERHTPDLPSINWGTNIGHWLSQSSLDRDYLGRFFTADDVAWIADQGMDHIRLPVDYPLFENEGSPSNYSEEGLRWIGRALDWCASKGLSVVLDMHILPGHSFSTKEHNLIWKAEAPHRRRAVCLWAMLARRFSAPHVVLELLNEPVAAEDAQWNDLAAELHATVRAEAPTSWIMVASNLWNSAERFASLRPIGDERTLYTFHAYEPFLFTHQNASWVPFHKALEGRAVPYPGPLERALLELDPGYPGAYGFMAEGPYGRDYLRKKLEPVLEFRRRHGLPLYCGEFGTVRTAPAPDRLRWYRDLTAVFKEEGIGRANWNYKSGNFGIRNPSGEVDAELLEALR